MQNKYLIPSQFPFEICPPKIVSFRFLVVSMNFFRRLTPSFYVIRACLRAHIPYRCVDLNFCIPLKRALFFESLGL